MSESILQFDIRKIALMHMIGSIFFNPKMETDKVQKDKYLILVNGLNILLSKGLCFITLMQNGNKFRGVIFFIIIIRVIKCALRVLNK